MYCNVSVLESWSNAREAGRKREERREKSWREKDKRVRVVERAREADREKDQGTRGKR